MVLVDNVSLKVVHRVYPIEMVFILLPDTF